MEILQVALEILIELLLVLVILSCFYAVIIVRFKKNELDKDMWDSKREKFCSMNRLEYVEEINKIEKKKKLAFKIIDATFFTITILAIIRLSI